MPSPSMPASPGAMATEHSSPASSSRLPDNDDDDDAFLSDSDIEFDDLSSGSGSALSADDDGDVFMSDTDADADGDGDAEAPDARAMTADADAWEERHRGVEYSVLGPAELEEKQLRERRDVASMFEIQDTDASTLLRYFSWNKERLIESFMERPEHFSAVAGLSTSSRPSAIQTLYPPADFTCEVCFSSLEDVGGAGSSGKGKAKSRGPGMETLALSCGHRFCTACYAAYLQQKVENEGESRRIQCLMEGCGMIVDENTAKLVLQGATLDRYTHLLSRTYVDDAPTLRWCPSPGCENAVSAAVPAKALRSLVPTVRCACGTEFCFGCGEAPGHEPTICKIAGLWLRKCRDDSETANWISANTKECPKCNSTIEKNGGCNHMTCRKCKYEWCWICAGPWSEHGNSWYNCNRFDEKSGTEARSDQAKSRAQLERYLHYFNRYANHEQSARLDRDLYARTEKKMEEMQLSSQLTWIEVQFLRKAVDTLSACRATLKWTYCMAFYLERDNMTELFEDNQRDLERAVEDLSEQLEKPITKETIPSMRQRVTDLTVYVAKRREILLADTADGHRDGRWKWSVPI